MADDRFADPIEALREPAVRDLEEIDDRYLALEKEHEASILALRKRYEEQYAKILERRRKILDSSGSGGTPALKGFWRTVLQNSAEFQEDIERHDEPVLDCLRDVRTEFLDENARDQGFKVVFLFGPNPYFRNETLEKTYHTERKSMYADRLECVKIDASAIEWHEGKNVTVEVVSRRVKSRRQARPAKPRKEELPRPSFFRRCFRNLGPDQEIPEEELEDSDVEDSLDLMDCLMDEDFEQGLAIRDHLVLHAVRWYTGEACEDEEEGESEESEEEDRSGSAGEEEEEESEEEDAAPPSRGRK